MTQLQKQTFAIEVIEPYWMNHIEPTFCHKQPSNLWLATMDAFDIDESWVRRFGGYGAFLSAVSSMQCIYIIWLIIIYILYNYLKKS
jgi:hypothetical protein